MDVELTPRRLSVYEEQLLRNIDNSIEHYAISKAKVSCPMALLVVLLNLKKFRNGIVPNNTRLRRRYIPSSIAILREISFPIESRTVDPAQNPHQNIIPTTTLYEFKCCNQG